MLLLAIAFLFVAVYLLRREYLFKTSRLREYGNKIPGPKPLPMVGNALEFGLSSKSIFQYLQCITKEYGPVARAWIGPKLGILLADPDSIEIVLGSSRNINKSSIYDIAKSFVGLGLLMNKGETWKRHRKIIAPAFQGQSLIRFVDIFNANADVLIHKLSQYANGPEFDISPLMNVYALDIICESAMGVKLNAQLQSDSDYVKGVNCLEDAMFIRAFRPWLHPDIIFHLTYQGRQQAKYLPIIQGETKRVIQERKLLRSAESNTNTEYYDNYAQDKDVGFKNKRVFLDYLLDHVAKGAQLNNEELQHEVDTIMIAGHDTTATSLGFTCWLLAKHQQVQEKALQELRTIFGDSPRHATIQDLNEMKYLEQVIKESLRIYPPASLFGRQLSEDVNTGKFILPAGSEVGINVYMLHRHPDYFPDPEKFDPDRFLPENCVGRHPYCYIPFSVGPRNCVGYKYAMLEMKATVSQLLRNYRIIPPENPFQDLELTLQIVTKSTNGIRIRIQPRDLVQRS